MSHKSPRPSLMSKTSWALLVAAIACLVAVFGVLTEQMFVMAFGIMLPVFASLIPLPAPSTR